MNLETFSKDKKWPFAYGGGATITLASTLLAAAIYVWYRYTNFAAGLFLVMAAALWLLILYFFRDPNRPTPNEPGQVVAPGDGEIVVIQQEYEGKYLQADVIRISMFLSVTNVHVQRAPIGGKVALVAHVPGKFLQAFKPVASDVNEYIAMVIESGYGRVLLKQIAGILARRCVNHAQPGDTIHTGQRFGLIKFGSRLDLYLPPTAKLLVQVGDKVTGGVTPIAQLK
ncbi:MAG: phosphatidylserine decarboxylase family protein [Candidatus Promineifilaceae bacterium]